MQHKVTFQIELFTLLMLEKIELAIQSELDLQAQLRREIQGLEQIHGQSSCSPSVLKFYNASLNKVISDTEELNTDIRQYETVHIPEMETKLRECQRMKVLAKKHIDQLDHLRQVTTVDEEITEDLANEIIQHMELELSEYDQILDSERKELLDLKQKLKRQQDQQYQEAKMRSETFWHDEVESEKTIKDMMIEHGELPEDPLEMFKRRTRSYSGGSFALGSRRRNTTGFSFR